MIKVHAIQTGSVAVKQRQQRGKGSDATRLLNTLIDRQWTEPLPIYAWVIEHPEGLLVIDTGETARTSHPGYFPWWHPYYRLGVREWVQPEEEIGPQLKKIGFNPDEVRWVVLTHLHTDHAGGLYHFPSSEILVSSEEYRQASGFGGMLRGYLPQHWPEWFAPRLVEFENQPFGSIPQSYSLTRAGDILLVPTSGHTPGHLSVILREDHDDIFFAGDTSYTQALMLEQVTDGVTPDGQAARRTLGRILKFVEESPVVYLPSHDPESAERLAKRQTALALPDTYSAARPVAALSTH